MYILLTICENKISSVLINKQNLLLFYTTQKQFQLRVNRNEAKC